MFRELHKCNRFSVKALRLNGRTDSIIISSESHNNRKRKIRVSTTRHGELVVRCGSVSFYVNEENPKEVSVGEGN